MNDFAAPFFSGCTFGAGLILIGLEHGFLGVWLLASAVVYWAIVIRSFYA